MNTFDSILHNERGATIVYVALVLTALIMFSALAVDVNHLYGVRNELQDSADAGALAGAAVLFRQSDGSLEDRTVIRTEGARVAHANRTGNQLVDVDIEDVLIGHWSFTQKKFTPSDATTQTTWQERPFAVLDLDPAFINAVQVTARRADTPSFLARIFNINQFDVSTDAVAYRGFAGTLHPGEIDRPIAICKDAIIKNDAYSCNMGRMLNSGGNANTAMTAMWTNYTQDPCSTASNSDMQDLTKPCSASNPNPITFGEGIGSQNGVQDNVFGFVTDCWLKAADSSDLDLIPDKLWQLLLPVIECGVDNTCAPLVGAVVVNVVWIIHQNDPNMEQVPLKMDNWSCSITPTTEAQRFACWKEFVNNFKLQNVTGPPVSDADYKEMYQKKNIFFLPDCTPHEPTGETGGENFGILARIPKLVE